MSFTQNVDFQSKCGEHQSIFTENVYSTYFFRISLRLGWFTLKISRFTLNVDFHSKCRFSLKMYIFTQIVDFLSIFTQNVEIHSNYRFSLKVS